MSNLQPDIGGSDRLLDLRAGQLRPCHGNAGASLTAEFYGNSGAYGGFSASNPTRDLLSGRAPGEMCTDEMINGADLPSQVTARSASIPLPPTLQSGKSTFKGGSPIVPKFLFIALKDRGMIDVFSIGTAEKVRTIELGGTPEVISSYWRQ